MDTRTGELYDSREEALAAGVPDKAIVELRGTEEAVNRVHEAVKDRIRLELKEKKARMLRKKRAKLAKASRRKNRRG